MVQGNAARKKAFEDKPQRRGDRRMATVSSVYSVAPHFRTADLIVAALFRDKQEYRLYVAREEGRESDLDGGMEEEEEEEEDYDLDEY